MELAVGRPPQRLILANRNARQVLYTVLEVKECPSAYMPSHSRASTSPVILFLVHVSINISCPNLWQLIASGVRASCTCWMAIVVHAVGMKQEAVSTFDMM